MSNGVASGMARGWEYATVWEHLARLRGAAPAIVHGERRVQWLELEHRAARLAAALLDRGVAPSARVAQHLFNCPEYVEAVFASFKASLVPVNSNYRYLDDELLHVWTDARCEVVVFDARLTDRVAAVRRRLGDVLWVRVGDEAGCPRWAEPYESLLDAGDPSRPRGSRSGDDRLFLYTGGTTGLPKGVVWRQDDLYVVLQGAAPRAHRHGEVADLDAVERASSAPGLVALPACPLMHGTGLFVAMTALTTGGTIVLLESERFDAHELLETIDRERVTSVAIVGDAFARPIIDALEIDRGRWSLESLRVLTSSGAILSESAKNELLRHVPWLVIVDSLGSSEGLGIGSSIARGASSPRTGRFEPGPDTCVIDADGIAVQPGSGVVGRLARRGRGPIGYHNDPVKTAETFVVIDGERYAVPGDHAVVNADGTLTLLGRGSGCINTGGEKVFAEEVEETLKLHGSVTDAAVVGIPDDRFGSIVAAVIACPPGARPSADDVREHCRGRLAAYKSPRAVRFVAQVPRGANGKIDYRRVRDLFGDRATPSGGEHR